jgi:hypothetical protein
MMLRRRLAGLAAVAATIAVLVFSITSLYFVAYLTAMNRGAEAAKQEARVGQAPRVPEVLSAYIYNASLCALFEGRLTQERMPWKLLVLNTGNVPAEVDSVVLSVDGNIMYQDSNRRTLHPGEYFAANLEDCGAFCGLYMSLGLVQVHTSRGGFFLGGYAVPRPDMVIRVDENRRCLEP